MNNWANGIGGSIPFSNGRLATYQFTGTGGVARTMCVLLDDNDYIYSGANYGPKGIITAYYVAGHVGPSGCARD